jgi:hypothetical protein
MASSERFAMTAAVSEYLDSSVIILDREALRNITR